MTHSLRQEIRALQTLRGVLCWAFGRTPTAELVAVVTQDEFTHDIVFRVDPETYLVFDTT